MLRSAQVEAAARTTTAIALALTKAAQGRLRQIVCQIMVLALTEQRCPGQVHRGIEAGEGAVMMRRLKPMTNGMTSSYTILWLLTQLRMAIVAREVCIH